MSANRCPVCGLIGRKKFGRVWYECGWEEDDQKCHLANDLAIARDAEIKRLQRLLSELLLAAQNLSAIAGEDGDNADNCKDLWQELRAAIANTI